jgi:hypothetical protein
MQFDVTDWPWQDPGEDVPDLVIRQGCTLGPTKNGEHIAHRAPTFLVADQSKINFG